MFLSQSRVSVLSSVMTCSSILSFVITCSSILSFVITCSSVLSFVITCSSILSFVITCSLFNLSPSLVIFLLRSLDVIFLLNYILVTFSTLFNLFQVGFCIRSETSVIFLLIGTEMWEMCLVLFYIHPIVPYAPASLHSFLSLVTVVKGKDPKRHYISTPRYWNFSSVILYLFDSTLLTSSGAQFLVFA